MKKPVVTKYSLRFAIAGFISILWPSNLHAQDSKANLFLSMHPDVSIVVKKHDMGADMVEMTYVNPGYPAEVAQQQIDNLASNLKSTARGVNLSKIDLGGPNRRGLLRATFAIDGLIDRQGGVLRISPIAKALAGAPKPNEIQGIMVIFDHENPGSRTIQNYFPGDGTVQVQARSDDSRLGVEYRVRLLTQNPDKIFIPEGTDSTKIEMPNVAKKSNDLIPWIILVIASISAGALVYSLLLQTRSRSSHRRRR